MEEKYEGFCPNCGVKTKGEFCSACGTSVAIERSREVHSGERAEVINTPQEERIEIVDLLVEEHVEVLDPSELPEKAFKPTQQPVKKKGCLVGCLILSVIMLIAFGVVGAIAMYVMKLAMTTF